MAYVETGPKTGEPVVLIHGYTDNIRMWSPAMTRCTSAIQAFTFSLSICAATGRARCHL